MTPPTTNTPTNTPTLPASPSAQAAGETGEGARKTGVFSICEYLMPEQKEWAITNVREWKKENIQERLSAAIGKILLSDSRQYAVQFLPYTETEITDWDKPAERLELSATVLLVHAADCAIGESCINGVDFAEYHQDEVTRGRGQQRFQRLPDGAGWIRIA